MAPTAKLCMEVALAVTSLASLNTMPTTNPPTSAHASSAIKTTASTQPISQTNQRGPRRRARCLRLPDGGGVSVGGVLGAEVGR